jgi:hypothetical protein
VSLPSTLLSLLCFPHMCVSILFVVGCSFVCMGVWSRDQQLKQCPCLLPWRTSVAFLV